MIAAASLDGSQDASLRDDLRSAARANDGAVVAVPQRNRRQSERAEGSELLVIVCALTILNRVDVPCGWLPEAMFRDTFSRGTAPASWLAIANSAHSPRRHTSILSLKNLVNFRLQFLC